MLRAYVVVLLTVLACSSASKTSADLSQAANLDQAAVSMSSAVEQYQQAATSAATPADCSAALQQYLARAQPLLDQMSLIAAPMDSYMKSAGSPMAGDVDCGVQVMSDELAHHRAVACTSADPGTNQAEALRHSEAMQSFAGHMEMRAVQAGGMISPNGMMMAGGQGPMMQDAGWMAGLSDGGWTAPDSGTVPFSQPMPGCTYNAGTYQSPDAGYWMDGGWVTAGTGSADAGTATVVDGGSGGATDGGTGPLMDGGTFNGALAGGAKRCEPPATCPGPAMMAPNYICPDQTIAGPACIALSDGTCAWRMLACL